MFAIAPPAVTSTSRELSGITLFALRYIFSGVLISSNSRWALMAMLPFSVALTDPGMASNKRHSSFSVL